MLQFWKQNAAATSSGGGSERGASLIEVLAVLLLLGLMAVIAAGLTPSILGREASRGASYTVQTFAQLARMEAVGRNHTCLFVVDITSGALQVVDLNDPSDPTDDIIVARTQIPSRVRFEAPSGTAVTLALLSGSRYGAVFSPDGTVQSGAGFVSLRGGERFDRVTIFGAGGAWTERWNGSGWIEG